MKHSSIQSISDNSPLGCSRGDNKFLWSLSQIDGKTGLGDTRFNDQHWTKRWGGDIYPMRFEVHCDYLRIRTLHPHLDSYEHMLEFLGDKLKDTWEDCPGVPMVVVRGIKKFPDSAISVKGMRSGRDYILDCDERSGWYEIEAITDIPGQVLSGISVVQFWKICCHLRQRWEAECLRFDVALDDFSRTITPEMILEVGRNKDCKKVTAYGLKESSVPGGGRSITAYLGSRESERMLRCYDAMLRHNINAIRLEAEFKGDVARLTFERFIETPWMEQWEGCQFEERLARWLGSLIPGSFDIREAGKGRKMRRARASWWQKLLDDIGNCTRLSPRRRQSCVQRSIDYLHRLKKCIHVVGNAVGGREALQQLIGVIYDKGAKAVGRHERAVLQQLEKERWDGVIPMQT